MKPCVILRYMLLTLFISMLSSTKATAQEAYAVYLNNVFNILLRRKPQLSLWHVIRPEQWPFYSARVV